MVELRKLKEDMENWEDEKFEPTLPALKKEPPKGIWDDEDADDQDVKESWEDEEETPQAPKNGPQAEKITKKSGPKATGKKIKQSEAVVTKAANEVLADPVAEELRQQRFVEEAYKSAATLFAKKNGEKSLENFIPKSEADFVEYAELLSHKLRPYEKSFHYVNLLKAVMRLSVSSLKAADAKEISSSVTAIANEKLKAEKAPNAGKKKQGAKKKQLQVDRPEDNIGARHYDIADDYDFM